MEGINDLGDFDSLWFEVHQICAKRRGIDVGQIRVPQTLQTLLSFVPSRLQKLLNEGNYSFYYHCIIIIIISDVTLCGPASFSNHCNY